MYMICIYHNMLYKSQLFLIKELDVRNGMIMSFRIHLDKIANSGDANKLHVSKS